MLLTLSSFFPHEQKASAIRKFPKSLLHSLLFLSEKSYATRRALFVSLVLITASIFQGLVVVQVYAEPLFTEAIPTMSATVSSVLFSIITVIAGFAAAYLTDVAGRKVLC